MSVVDGPGLTPGGGRRGQNGVDSRCRRSGGQSDDHRVPLSSWATKKPRHRPRSPGAAFWSTGTLAAHRLPSRQQRRGNVAKKDEAVPAGGSRPVVADGLAWSPDASVHGGTVKANPQSVKPLVQ